MANKIIKYNLEANGTIPTYIDDGGYYPKANENASPQDWDLIGATTDGATLTNRKNRMTLLHGQIGRDILTIIEMSRRRCKERGPAKL